MKSPTSLWNKTLLRHFVTQTIWITILYTVISLIVLPFSLWLSSFDMAGQERFDSEELLKSLAWIHLAFGMLYALILGLFSFNYKNKENVSDFIHSLPVKRVTILTSVYIVGVLSIVIPTVFIAVIIVFQRYTLFFEIPISDIFIWLIYSITAMVLMFIFTVLAGFFTNHLFVHLQLVVIIFFLPLALWAAVLGAATMMFDGVAGLQMGLEGNLLRPLADNTFPMLAMSQIFDSFSWVKSAVWVGAALAGVLFSYILYLKRKNERVNSNFTYYSVRMILSVLITVLGMLVFGNVMGLILSENNFMRIVAFLFGWMVSYIIVEMLFQSTVKMQLRVKTLVISIISAVILMTVFYFGWTTYVNYVPDADEVKSVRINEGYLYTYDENGVVMNDDFMMVKDEAFIEDALDAHQFAVDNRVARDITTDGNKFEIIYNMEDGDRVHRTFNHFPVSDEGYDILKNLRDYSKVIPEDVIYNAEHPENIHKIILNFHGENRVHIDDESEKAEFVEKYKNEFESNVPEELGLLQMGSEQHLNVQLSFTGDEYIETIDGEAIIYNPAVISKISETMRLSEFISIDRAENVYIYEITGEISEFYDDMKYSGFEELQDKYDIETLGSAEKAEAIEEIDQGNISADSDKIIIYDNPDHSPYYEENEYDVPERSQDTHFIIGIE